MSCSDDEKKAFVQTLKLALATSIIRSKPDHLTSKQYAAQLATKLKDSERSWKSKYDDMEKHLQRAKEEIVLLKLKSTGEGEKFNVESENEEKETTVQGANFQEMDKSSEKSFLSTVVNLKCWSQKLHHDKQSLDVIKKNIVVLMKEAESTLRSLNINEHSIQIVECNIALLTDMLKNEQFVSDAKIKSCLCTTIRTLVTVLMNCNAQYSVKFRLKGCLDRLCRTCTTSRDVVMGTLVLVVNGYTALLKGLPSFVSLNVDKYDNVGYICQLLTDIVATCSKWPCQKLYEYSQSLDDGLMEISSPFLMYAQTIWTISSLMMDVKYERDNLPTNLMVLN